MCHSKGFGCLLDNSAQHRASEAKASLEVHEYESSGDGTPRL